MVHGRISHVKECPSIWGVVLASPALRHTPATLCNNLVTLLIPRLVNGILYSIYDNDYLCSLAYVTFAKHLSNRISTMF